MPVSKNKLKIPRIYLQIIRKNCNLTRAELAQKLGVCTSTIDRYENGSCDFFPDKLSLYLNRISELCGISISTLLQNESDYQLKTNKIRTLAKDKAVSIPAISSQKQLANIKLIQEQVGLETLPDAVRLVAEARIKYPEIKLSELADKLNITYAVLTNILNKIKRFAEDLERGQKYVNR